MFKSLQSILILHFTPSLLFTLSLRLHFTLSLQSAFYTQSAFYPWSAVCSLQSAVCVLHGPTFEFHVNNPNLKTGETVSRFELKLGKTTVQR